MDSKKKLFTVDTEDSEESNSLKNSLGNSLILKSFNLGFNFELLSSMFPTPEEEIEEIEKDEEILKEKIKEAEENLELVTERMKSNPEEIENLQEKWELIHNLLESYEYDLKYNTVHKKSLTNIYFEENDDKAEENFSNQFPELLATSIFSSKKKMEDVNTIVKKTEKKTTTRIIEECIYCELVLKDDKGRKTSKQHFHFVDLEGVNLDFFEYYKPVICVDCIKKIDENIVFQFNNELQESEEELSFDNDCCKKGLKIFSNNLSGNYPILIQYFEKIIQKEKEKNKENIMMKPEKNIFDL
jgi:hypothetical protein